MTVVDGWYSAALVVKYTVGGFRHYLFCSKSVRSAFSRKSETYRRLDFKIQRRDGNENVDQEVNLRSFSLYSDYPIHQDMGSCIHLLCQM